LPEIIVSTIPNQALGIDERDKQKTLAYAKNA